MRHRRPATLRIDAIETRLQALALAQATLDKKALEPVLLHVEALVSYADYVLVATATSAPHALAIADACLDAARLAGLELLAQEGRDSARWVLVDFGDVVVHIFQVDDRGYYDLEGLWADAPRVEVPGAEPAPTWSAARLR
jgi:ribosome-associated protein